ncbi:hypothetical protein GP486_008380, partial [Trichoglossum hirsutum]
MMKKKKKKMKKKNGEEEAKVKNSIGIPIPEHMKKTPFTVPSLPSLSPRKKWAVGDRVSGLFSGRIFNRLEVKEIIDTSVKNYETSDPSKRYSRARNTVDPLALVLESDSDSAPSPAPPFAPTSAPMSASAFASAFASAAGKDKKLPPLPRSSLLRPETAASRRTPIGKVIASDRPSSRDSTAAERGSPIPFPEPSESEEDSCSFRWSLLMDPQNRVEGDEEKDVEKMKKKKKKKKEKKKKEGMEME